MPQADKSRKVHAVFSPNMERKPQAVPGKRLRPPGKRLPRLHATEGAVRLLLPTAFPNLDQVPKTQCES